MPPFLPERSFAYIDAVNSLAMDLIVWATRAFIVLPVNGKRGDPMTLDIDMEVTRFRSMTVKELREEYLRVFEEETRSHHKEYLVRCYGPSSLWTTIRQLPPGNPRRHGAQTAERGARKVDCYVTKRPFLPSAQTTARSELRTLTLSCYAARLS